MKKEWPKVVLVADPEKDFSNALGFICEEEDKFFLEYFFRGEAAYLLDKKFSKEEREREIRKYVEAVFREHAEDIRRGVEEACEDWAVVSDGYFKLVSDIFGGHPWPAGEYMGAASVFGMFPRFIDEKLFFFPYVHNKPRFANRVIAHESLHFMFFDFIRERYGLDEDSEVAGKDEEYVWRVSEVFNTMIECWPPYQEAIDYHEDGEAYPGQEEMVKEMKQQWQEKQDAVSLLDQWFSLVVK